jgi:hypothetical protein
MKIGPVGAELFHADGRQTDMTKLIVACHNFSKATKKGYGSFIIVQYF